MVSRLAPPELYKCLGIMECNTVKNQLLKSLLAKEYCMLGNFNVVKVWRTLSHNILANIWFDNLAKVRQLPLCHKQCVRKLLCTKLTSRNLVLIVNVYCISYSGGIISVT